MEYLKEEATRPDKGGSFHVEYVAEFRDSPNVIVNIQGTTKSKGRQRQLEKAFHSKYAIYNTIPTVHQSASQ